MPNPINIPISDPRVQRCLRKLKTARKQMYYYRRNIRADSALDEFIESIGLKQLINEYRSSRA